MIKDFTEFINEEWWFNKPEVDSPEFKSLDDLDSLHKSKNRSLTNNELKLVDEYISKFEKAFLINDELINDTILNFIKADIDVKIEKTIKTQGHFTDFNARNEIKDLKSLLSLKRWYDEFIGSPIIPTHVITINNKDKTKYKAEEILYKSLEKIKEKFEKQCDCEVKIKKDSHVHLHGISNYILHLTIEYPKTIIE